MPVSRLATAALVCVMASGCRAPERIEAAPCLAATVEQPMGPKLQAALEEIATEAGLKRDESKPGHWQFLRADGSVALSYQKPDASSGGVVAVFREVGQAEESPAQRTLRSEIGEFPLWFPGIMACSQVPGLTPPALLVD